MKIRKNQSDLIRDFQSELFRHQINYSTNLDQRKRNLKILKLHYLKTEITQN